MLNNQREFQAVSWDSMICCSPVGRAKKHGPGAQLSRALHPDKNPDLDKAETSSGTEIFSCWLDHSFQNHSISCESVIIINWISDFSDWIIQWFSESLSLWLYPWVYLYSLWVFISPFHHKQWIRGSSGLPPTLRGVVHLASMVRRWDVFLEVTVMVTTTIVMVPSGERLHNYGKIHHFQWVNPRTKWPFSIAMLNYRRLVITTESNRVLPRH